MKFLLPLAAVMSMAAAPAMAAPQAPRAEQSVQDNSELNGTGFVIGLLALAAAIVAVIVVSKGDEEPASP